MKKFYKHIAILIAAVVVITGCTAIFIGKSKTTDINIERDVSVDSVNVEKTLNIKKDIKK